MAEQNKFKRATIFLKRYINAKSCSFNAQKRQQRTLAPKILLNSIPKAGTNLMDSILQEYPGICPRSGRTLMTGGLVQEKEIKKVLSIKKGFYQLAHLPSDDNLLSSLRGSDIKIIFIIRDPRDIIISNFKYVLSIDITHKAHNYIKSLESDHERIKACIVGGEKDILSPVNVVYDRYEKWLDFHNCLVVRFEELVGSRGGSSDELQFETLQKIATFLNVNMSSIELQNVAEKMKTPNTPTFRTGKTGGWRGYFNDELIDLFNSKMGSLMNKYGYS
jgi:hypothetical protein